MRQKRTVADRKLFMCSCASQAGNILKVQKKARWAKASVKSYVITNMRPFWDLQEWQFHMIHLNSRPGVVGRLLGGGGAYISLGLVWWESVVCLGEEGWRQEAGTRGFQGWGAPWQARTASHASSRVLWDCRGQVFLLCHTLITSLPYKSHVVIAEKLENTEKCIALNKSLLPIQPLELTFINFLIHKNSIIVFCLYCFRVEAIQAI